MEITIKVTNALENETIEFLINESYILFSRLRGYYKLSKEINEQQKEQLKSMYINVHNKNDKIYIAYVSNIIVGCAYINDSGYLSHIFVKEEYQRQGIGSLLLKNIISDMDENKEITLNTHSEVLDFYKKYDFSVVAEGDNFIKMKRK